MGDKIEIEITRREVIKPCSPTPQHLRTVKLSFLDQFMDNMYIPLILFYPFIASNRSHIQQSPIEIAFERSQRLQETLSKALTLYYPFAGRLRNDLFIECNDEGAEFVEAKAAFPMSGILKCPDSVMQRKLLVTPPETSQESLGGCILLAQATIFKCGGIALGLSFCHKVVDAFTVAGFVKSWAKIAHDDNHGELLPKPEFGQAFDLFPPNLDLISSETSPRTDLVQDNCTVTRRFVFTAEKIAALKSIAASEYGNPTRVEAVIALLWKCAAKASALRSNNPPGSSRKSVMRQAINIRKRLVPPLGDNVVGNIVWLFWAKTNGQEVVNDLRVLVEKIRKGLKETVEICSNKEQLLRTIKVGLEEYISEMLDPEIDSYTCSSFCRLGFYEADFGWEKPRWVSIAGWEFKDSIMLMDTRDGGGIEAFLMFTQQDMASFETDEDLLAFASLNPSILSTYSIM